MATKWKIETIDSENKKVEFSFENGTVEILDHERPVKMEELNDLWGMARMMSKSSYVKMECEVV